MEKNASYYNGKISSHICNKEKKLERRASIRSVYSYPGWSLWYAIEVLRWWWFENRRETSHFSGSTPKVKSSIVSLYCSCMAPPGKQKWYHVVSRWKSPDTNKKLISVTPKGSLFLMPSLNSTLRCHHRVKEE